MAKPWRKQWPYVARSGARSYNLGYRDHERVERSRSFPTARHATKWRNEFIAAERRGPESLKRFLLDLDAREANEQEDRRTIAEVIQLYFAFNAPDTPDGLAPRRFAPTSTPRADTCSARPAKPEASTSRPRRTASVSPRAWPRI